MSKRPIRLRRRTRDETHNLSALLDFIIDHKDLVIAEYEASRKEIKEAEEKAKKQEHVNFFAKKMTYGSMVMWIWLSQLPMGFMWFLIFRNL